VKITLTILLIFTSSLFPQDRGIYEIYENTNARLTLYSDSTFLYKERKPAKIIDRGKWTSKSDTIAIESNEITKELGRRYFVGNTFDAHDQEIQIAHPKYKILMVLNKAWSDSSTKQ